MNKRITGNWTMYRKPKDVDLWLRFQLVCLRLGLSESSAVTEAVQHWTAKHEGRDDA